MDNKKDFKFRQNIILVVLGVTLLVALLNLKTVAGVIGTVAGFFTPLLVGGIIAFILNVPMSFLEKQVEILNARKPSKFLEKGKTPICLIITLVLFVLAVYFIGMVIFPNLTASVVSIVEIVKTSYPEWLAAAESYGIDTSIIKEYIAKIDFVRVANELKSNFASIIFTAGHAVTSVVGVVGNIAFGFIFAVYILLSKKKLGKQARKIVYAYLPEVWADEICGIASLTYKTFSSFLSGQCKEAIILGTMFAVALSIGGFPSAVTIGMIIGVMSLIPYVGAFIGMAFGVLLISVEGLSKVIIFVIVFFIIQQIEGQIIYPRVVGGSVGLPAMWTLLAVVVGGSVSGIFGIIVFIPIFSVIYALIRRDVYGRLKKKELTLK